MCCLYFPVMKTADFLLPHVSSASETPNASALMRFFYLVVHQSDVFRTASQLNEFIHNLSRTISAIL